MLIHHTKRGIEIKNKNMKVSSLCNFNVEKVELECNGRDNQGNKKYKVKDGKLGDIAPTLLKVMGIEIPKEMTGNILVE